MPFPFGGNSMIGGRQAPLITTEAEEEQIVPLSASWHLAHKHSSSLANKVLPFRTLKIGGMTQGGKYNQKLFMALPQVSTGGNANSNQSPLETRPAAMAKKIQ